MLDNFTKKSPNPKKNFLELPKREEPDTYPPEPEEIEIDSGPAPKKPERPKKPSKLRFIDHRERWSKLSLKHKLIVIFTALLVIGTGAAIANSLLGSEPESSIEIAKGEPKPTTVPSPLTGVQIEPELASRPVTGIMIENSLAARPQSGLRNAGIVFEAIAEGGITRFIALYQEDQPKYIGPVRSLRPYYLDFAVPFEASIAHVGGSPQALQQVRNGLRDLDQFFNPGAYWRISSRSSPHNVYTGFDRLDALNKAKKYTKSKFTPWPRKGEEKATTPTATTINLAISGPLYNASYKYDAKTNSYLRSEGGKAHVSTSSEKDRTGKQIRPKVVLALVMSRRIVDSSGHNGYGVTGKGIAYVFQDGKVVKGTWVKKNRKGQFTFVDAKGQPVKFNAGQAWVTVVSASSQVKYSAPAPKPAS